VGCGKSLVVALTKLRESDQTVPLPSTCDQTKIIAASADSASAVPACVFHLLILGKCMSY
jgi:hypothetical protein